jgi:hypothetical protein
MLSSDDITNYNNTWFKINSVEETFMGVRLVKAFEVARKNGGAQAQFRLAIRAGMSIKKAEKEPDNQRNILKMQMALTEVLGKQMEI